MFAVETYAAVRKFVFVEGKSRREAARVFGLSRETIAKMCRYSAPPGYVRSKEPERPKLGPLLPVIDAILDADKAAPPKQRHTAKRIFERLRIECVAAFLPSRHRSAAVICEKETQARFPHARGRCESGPQCHEQRLKTSGQSGQAPQAAAGNPAQLFLLVSSARAAARRRDDLVNGNAALSPEMALRIEKAFGVSMDTLLRMQAWHDATHPLLRKSISPLAPAEDKKNSLRPRHESGELGLALPKLGFMRGPSATQKT
jgi:hypothetical protein